MNTILRLGLAVTSFAGSLTASPAPATSADSVKAITQKVAHWQIETFEDQAEYRAFKARDLPMVETYLADPENPRFEADNKENRRVKGLTRKWHDRSWENGALYTGMNQWLKVSGDPAIEEFLMKIGERNNWELHNRRYHADDHTVGQMYLSLYETHRDPKMLKPTRERFDWILANPKTGSLEHVRGSDAYNRWGWCDALFMAPPVWVRLAKITGEQKYLDSMDQEYHATYDLLWSGEDQLFWRDTRFFTQHEANGRNLFWSRGNGWAFGGLAVMIPDMPKNWEGRDFYINVFKQMAESLKKCQRADGTWNMGLLGGEEAYPKKETSGTAFFTFGLAWGINYGLLDRAVYQPVIDKAWNALTECVSDEGLLEYVQPVGAEPGEAYAGQTEVYGIGAFLAAGAEVYKLVGGQ